MCIRRYIDVRVMTFHYVFKSRAFVNITLLLWDHKIFTRNKSFWWMVVIQLGFFTIQVYSINHQIWYIFPFYIFKENFNLFWRENNWRIVMNMYFIVIWGDGFIYKFDLVKVKVKVKFTMLDGLSSHFSVSDTSSF